MALSRRVALALAVLLAAFASASADVAQRLTALETRLDELAAGVVDEADVALTRRGAEEVVDEEGEDAADERLEGMGSEFDGIDAVEAAGFGGALPTSGSFTMRSSGNSD